MPASPASSSLPPGSDAVWSTLIPEEQWRVFAAGADALERAGIDYLLGGAMALATYTDHWRNTKDVDVIVRAANREAAVAALGEAGFEDYFQREGYDRSWIFRGWREGVIFDVIWDLPNHRVSVDDAWFVRSRPLVLRGRRFRSLGPEELVRIKLYVLQRGRCDWVDVLNVLAASVREIDWPFLVQRMGRDLPLLQAVLSLFNWMSPARAQELPRNLRERFALPQIDAEDLAAMEERRTRLLDSRPWFALHQPVDKPLEL